MPRLNAQGVPEWDYESYPSPQLREARCAQVLADIAGGHMSLECEGRDTRPVHFRMFDGQTEPGESYFAGHYRGEPFPYLDRYCVGVASDARVGVPPDRVAAEMTAFESAVVEVARLIDRDAGKPASPESIVRAVGAACALLVEFLRIHPYANGNGHMGRFLVWLSLARAGIWPRRWPLNDKVPYPYGMLLTEYRNGNREPLIRFVLGHV